MDWIERLNKAISYLEEHIKEETDYEQAAKIACCSTYHFQRMFTYMAGIPLQSTYAADACPWLPRTCREAMRKSWTLP